MTRAAAAAAASAAVASAASASAAAAVVDDFPGMCKVSSRRRKPAKSSRRASSRHARLPSQRFDDFGSDLASCTMRLQLTHLPVGERQR